MYSSGGARALGWRLGHQQRLEHDRLMPRVMLQDAAVLELARLAWRFEPHDLADTPHHRRCFIEGYKQGYLLTVRPVWPIPLA
jgi:hypothetical protein